MLEKLKLVEARYLEMAERAAQPDFYNDPKAASQLLKEQRQLEPIITAYRSYRRTQAEQEDLRAMLSEGLEPEMKALCQEEFSENKKKLEALEQELKILLLPRDPNDDKSVIMEIRGGVGGEESALFAHSLYRMYTMYAQSKGWKVTLLNYNETELGGVKEADFEIDGDGAYSRLKFESGVHRVQRVPETESGGRVHTSTATVAVLPEMEEADVSIRPEDIDIVPVEQGQLVGTVTNVTFKGMQYDIIVDFYGFKWLIQTTDLSPVGSRIGIKIDPDGIHVMKKSPYSGMFGDYSSFSNEFDELSDAESEIEE